MFEKSRIEWTYAGERFSIGEDAQVEVAISWDNGSPTWKRAIGRVALDACAAEIIWLNQRVTELEERAERG